MKRVATLLLLITLSFTGFSHEAKKQTEPFLPEGITQKWLAYKSAEKGERDKLFQDFYNEVKKSEPDDTVVYYFPDAKNIYENILQGIKENDTQKIEENVYSWEILQKNFIQFQLQQLYYSYRILIFVIIFAVLISLVFFILYILSSKLRKENLALTAQMIKTQEAERERISNELHDTVCQDLRVLQFRLEDEESVSLCKKLHQMYGIPVMRLRRLI